MIPSKLLSLPLALALLAPSFVHAWEEVPTDEPFMAIEDHNLQWFEPVEVDLDGDLYERSGFYFGYEKLYWNTTGERTTIGDPDVFVLSEDIFPVNPQDIDDFGMAPVPYQIINGIQNAPPDATFAWGNRYEAGYTCGNRGWMIGVLDGPDALDTRYYGFQLRNEPTLIEDPDFPVPVFKELLTGYEQLVPVTGEVIIDPVTQMPIPIPTPNGWGSIHVNFRIPDANFLKGFRDYHTTTLSVPDLDELGGGRWVVQSGPSLIVDEIPDDIDENGINGFAVIIIGGVPFFITDFNDLHNFNIRFNSLIVRNSSTTDGVELMRTHQFDNRHRMQKNQHKHFELGYGVRFLRLNDTFSWQGYGDILGFSFVDMKTDNSIVGPQVRMRYEDQRGKWRFNLDGRAMLGWNIQDTDFNGGLGYDLNPGALNKPVIFQPTYFDYGRRDDSFAPVGELRAEASYQLTSALELKLGYTFMFIDGISRSASLVDYVLPDMGIRPGGKQEIFINGVNFGIELNH